MRFARVSDWLTRRGRRFRPARSSRHMAKVLEHPSVFERGGLDLAVNTRRSDMQEPPNLPHIANDGAKQAVLQRLTRLG